LDEVFATFTEMNRKGLTLLMVEQEIQLSLSISDRGYLLRNGRLIKEGSPSILMKSQDLGVLGLGGEMNKSLFSLLPEGDRNEGGT
jgi:branched-chain amino acid transport system ATP-binding protein